MRWESRVMVYRLLCSDKITIGLIIASCVQIPANAGKITTGNGQCNTMPRLKFVAGEPEIDLITIYLSRLDELRAIQSVSKPSADHAVG